MVVFLGLPQTVQIGAFTVSTSILLMAVFLSVAVFITISGGLITVMVTDCIEGILSQLFYLIIIAALLVMFSWGQINEVLAARPPGQSLVNPFDSSGLKDFNIWYTLMSIFVGVYGTMAWQNASAYNSAAVTPHAGVMGGILGRWREFGKVAVVTLLAVCAMTYLQHPDFAAGAAQVKQDLQQIANPHTQKQMEIPMALSQFLPVGIHGILCAVLIMGIFGGDSTHLHSWSGIFVQDVLVPLRRKPFTPKQHIRMLRLAIMGVALFAFLFGALFQQTEYVIMWFAVTMAIYVGGAGAVIIGGLYWKKGTTAGAWAALLTGSGLSVAGILLRQMYGGSFPLNGTQISFLTSLSAIAVYVVVSLLTHRQDYNLDRLLHRGEFAGIKEEVGEVVEKPQKKAVPLWSRLIGIDENFSFSDKWVAGGLFIWSMLWFGIFLIGTVWNMVAPWPNSMWSSYWHVAGIGVPVFMALVTGVWFTWGGIRDIRALFTRLKEHERNHLDDGTVVGHQNLDEKKAVDGHASH